MGKLCNNRWNHPHEVPSQIPDQNSSEDLEGNDQRQQVGLLCILDSRRPQSGRRINACSKANVGVLEIIEKLGDYDDEEEETLLMGAITTEDARWDKLIRSYHEDHLHPGKTAMLTGLRPRQIPEITERVKRILGACTLCQLKRPPVPYVNLKTDHPQPSQAWEWSQMDTLSISHDPPLKAIIIIDEFSRWIEMLLITGAPSATAVIQLLSQWVSRHQPPAGWHLRADRGSEFRNTEVESG